MYHAMACLTVPKLSAVENGRQSEDDPTICEQDGMSRSDTISVCLQCVLNHTV